MPAKPLLPHERADSARLKLLFAEWQYARKQAGAPSSQEVAASLLGFGQSALNQYLNGKIPLNVEAAIKFAEMLDQPVSTFSPTLADQVSKYAAAAESRAEESPPDAMDMDSITRQEMKLIAMYRLASKQERQAYDGLTDSISIRISGLARDKGKRGPG